MRQQKLARALLVLSLVSPMFATLGAQQEPPRRLDFTREEQDARQSRDSARVARDTARVAGETTREMRTAFVRSQTILGLTAYGPTFATLVGDDALSFTAGYLLMAGGSFFVATELTRQLEITRARQILSSRMAWRGTMNGIFIGAATDMGYRRSLGMGWLLGTGGTALGLYAGRNLTEGEAVAMVVGHDIAHLSAYAVFLMVDPNSDLGTTDGLSPQYRTLGATVAGWAGYRLGLGYARSASYEVTAGDALLLWSGAAIGATAFGALIADGNPEPQTVAGTVLAGGLAGIWGADRWLVRRFDHTTSEGSLVALGGIAGALIGIGTGVLIVGEAERGASVTMAFGAAGAAGGIWLTERYAQPAMDGGGAREVGRVHFNPMGAMALASRAEGLHPLLRITF
jgi:hypothetical protein